MRRLVTNTFITLDGVMQAPGGPDEDRSGGFAYGGWTAHYWDDSMNQFMEEFMGRPFEILLGRKTYDIFAAYWPHATGDPADALNSAKKYVASKSLKDVAWNNSELLAGDVAKAVAELKSQDGPEIQVHGSGNLIQTLMAANLIDEMRLMIFPVTVGSGKRLFAEGTPAQGLKITSSRTSSTGVIMAAYEPGLELQTGTVGLEEAS